MAPIPSILLLLTHYNDHTTTITAATDTTTLTTHQVTKEDDWNTLLRMEEEYIENVCAQIVAFKPDIVITEKGVSDLAQHYFMKANITCFRRLRKSDNNRVARAVGATIVSRPDEIQESDIGTGCGLFEVRKIGDE
jgi:T-complex protein 1 subunit gamma